MTIAHTGIKTTAASHAAVVAWYEAALAPLGYKRAMAYLDDAVVGFADSTGNIDWWITSAAAAPPGVPAPAHADVTSIPPTHTAFGAKGELLSRCSSIFFRALCLMVLWMGGMVGCFSGVS